MASLTGKQVCSSSIAHCYPFVSSVEIKETDGSSQIKQEPDPTW